MSVHKIFAEITNAIRFEDLMKKGETRDDAYKRLAKLCHPDKFQNGDQAAAEEVFKKLNDLHAGKKKPETIIGKWKIKEPFAYGDVANLYYTDDGNVFKIARSSKDNDLMDREQKALQKLAKTKGQPFSRYVPELYDSLTASSRRANVIQGAEGFMTLEDLATRFNHRLDFRHVVWMMNRALSALGWLQNLGLVHGAILPSHLLYKPEDHDMRLIDWCYSAQQGETIPAIVTKYKHSYPSEVKNKKQAGSVTDLYMLAKTFNQLTDVPKNFKPLFEWCLAESPFARPEDTWSFQDKFRSAAKALYGEPKFVPLVVPVAN